LATKAKKPAAKPASTTKVTRITARDDKASTKTAVKAEKKVEATKSKRSFPQKLAVPFIATGRYFAGSWYELRQVNWPDRKATWSLTLAMLAFTGFFAALILLLDALFKYLFQLILG
jgi:preprotein translocase SecE subunit